MMSTDTMIILAANIGGICFYAGIHARTLKNQGDKIEEVKTEVNKVKADVEVHDREIGSVYGAIQMQREVRR